MVRRGPGPVLSLVSSRLRGRAGLARIAFAVALAVLVKHYCGALYHETDAPRGEGVYRPYIAVQDGHMMYLHVLTLVFDRDFDISDEVERFGRTSISYETDDGRPYYPSALGPTLVWAPMLALAHGASKVVGLFGWEVEDHGYTLFHQRIVYLTSPLLAWIACLFAYVVCRRTLGGFWAPLLAALAVLFGTNAYYYGVLRPDYGHALSAALGAAFLGTWALTRGRMDLRRFAILGALAGACGLARINDVALGIVIVVELFAYVLARRGEEPLLPVIGRAAFRGAVALAAALLALSLQLVVWKIHSGMGLLESPGVPGYVHLGRPHLLEFLFSRMNGYFSTHPLAYAGVIGLVALPRAYRLLGVGLLAAVAVEVYFNACVWDWHGIGSYGARRMTALTFAHVVGLCALLRIASRALRRVPHPGRLVLGVVGLAWFVVWNVSYAEVERERRRAEPAPICCDEVPRPMERLAKPIYERFGNPFAFPANVWFALRWGVEIERWDQAMAGTYAIQPSLGEFRDRRHLDRWYPWNLAGANFGPYIVYGLGPHQGYRSPGRDRPVYLRWGIEEQVKVFVPLFLVGDHDFEVPIHPNLGPGDPPARIRIAINGRSHYDEALGPGWTRAAFRVPAAGLRRGMNLLEIRGALPAEHRTAPVEEGGLPPHPHGNHVSFAVGTARLKTPDGRR